MSRGMTTIPPPTACPRELESPKLFHTLESLHQEAQEIRRWSRPA